MDVVENNLRQFRDFMLLYNSISETCFNYCITGLYQRNLSDPEVQCIDQCVGKHMTVNHKIMSVYSEVQPVYMQRRLDDMMKQTQILEQAKIDAENIEDNSAISTV